MKEFRAQTGGRYTYVDDIENLQDLALAFSAIFSDCDNFIITGCEVQGTSITPGYVYLGGKIRYCNGKSDITKWPQLIYNTDIEESVSYASGGSKVGRMNYTCGVGDVKPMTSTQVIRVPQTGGVRMREAFFGKYALLLQTTAAVQDVVGQVNFKNTATIDKTLTLNTDLQVNDGEQSARIYYDDDHAFVIQSRIQEGAIIQIKIDDDGGVRVMRNDTEFCSLKDGKLSLTHSVAAPSAEFGVVTINQNGIFESSSEDNATLYINMYAPVGGVNTRRTTVIGDGLGNALITTQSATITLHRNTVLANNAQLTLKSNNTVAQGFTNLLSWRDKDGVDVGAIGFMGASDMSFTIRSTKSDVNILGYQAVNIGPAIKENGVLLSEKYMTILKHDASLQAALATRYTRSEVNEKFAQKNDGLTQFIGRFSAASLRTQIGALGTPDVDGIYVRIDGLLGGIATTVAQKRTACGNIGAAYIEDVQQKLRDTGWLKVENTNLYARQLGDVVYIQGTVVTRHQNEQFALPNSIEAPKYGVSMSAPGKKWGCYIAGGSRSCIAVCDGDHGDTINFSLTYMV